MLKTRVLYLNMIYLAWLHAEVLRRFEAWPKLAQQWLVCAPLGINGHFEPINKELMLLVTI